MDLKIDAIVNSIGVEWKDRDLIEKIRNTPSFNSPEYLDRTHFVGLKLSEIRLDYPEYISNAPKDIVDISCGNGICLEIMRYFGHNVQGLDNNHSGFLNFPRSQSIPLIEFDGNKMPIPLPDKSYDLVISVGAVHHYRANWGDVLDEFFRIARETIFVSMSKGKNFFARREELDLHPIKKRWVSIKMPEGKYKFIRK